MENVISSRIWQYLDTLCYHLITVWTHTYVHTYIQYHISMARYFLPPPHFDALRVTIWQLNYVSTSEKTRYRIDCYCNINLYHLYSRCLYTNTHATLVRIFTHAKLSSCSLNFSESSLPLSLSSITSFSLVSSPHREVEKTLTLEQRRHIEWQKCPSLRSRCLNVYRPTLYEVGELYTVLSPVKYDT